MLGNGLLRKGIWEESTRSHCKKSKKDVGDIAVTETEICENIFLKLLLQICMGA